MKLIDFTAAVMASAMAASSLHEHGHPHIEMSSNTDPIPQLRAVVVSTSSVVSNQRMIP